MCVCVCVCDVCVCVCLCLCVCTLVSAQMCMCDRAGTELCSYINGYDDPDIIAGPGTCGMEIVEQGPDVDEILVPIGGGGLIAGIALAVKTLRPDTQVRGCRVCVGRHGRGLGRERNAR